MSGGSGKALTNQSQGGGFEAINPGVSQSVQIGTSSVQSNQLGLTTSVVRMFCTSDCFLAFGRNPTSTVSGGYFLPSGIIDFIGVIPNSKVAVIMNSSVGTLYLTEGA